MTLNIEFELWEEVFAIARSNRDLLEMAKLPYAEYLLKHDRYEEALRAFKAAGRYDLTTKMMKEMSANCVEEHRFEEAS
jgi:intraflagellar transport protein 122